MPTFRPAALVATTLILATAPLAVGAPARTLFDLSAPRIDGKPQAFAAWRGRPVLVVNTASKCGFTPQYKGLEKLHGTYGRRGLVVAGFPSNDFLFQEPGTNAEIAAFCGREYDVSFPMFAKVSTNGEDVSPVYAFLLADAAARGQGGAVKWNFEKFVVGRDGHVRARFGSTVAPEDPRLVQAVEAALAAK
jgi:glutathione peroxidase